MIGKLLLTLWILRWTSFIDPVAGQFSSLDDSADEKNDAEIFRAVVESMRQWTLHKTLYHRKKREVSKVCYEDVGCFEDTGPFSYLEMLPSPPKDVGTRFLIYGTRRARSIPMEVPADDINDNTHRAIDPALPTKVIVHGFGSHCHHLWVYDMRSALMSIQDCNIVCVDWGPGSAVPNYVRAAANTRLVGRQLAKLIRNLNVPLEKVHMIGFSLGAHVAGFAGAELGNVSRITGLDPAGPLFESQDPRVRLDATDANFVDVIHSNGEQLILGGLGSWQPMGDVDYYPNGGKVQSGCSNIFLGAVSDIIWSSAVEGKSLCNHRRAYKFFTDSVSPKCRFPAFPCEEGYEGLLKGECFPCSKNSMDRSCGNMGYYSNESSARGKLYLMTREEEPFCAHQYQIKVYNNRNERSVKTYGKLQVMLVGKGSYNDTFAMTRKDEELLVGAILQKIIVPHPAVTNLEAIEIKYTAYSGWISSGLVSWIIDKVAIIDSFGKTLSVCQKDLILESDRPVYLPLYPGECNIPLDIDNSTVSSVSAHERVGIEEEQQQQQQQQPGSIGPFTKEQNYETKDSGYAVEILSTDRMAQRKNLGPFTKEQNLRVVEVETMAFAEDAEKRRNIPNPWTVLDISSDGDSNSLENADSERGRSFSGANLMYHTSAVQHAAEANATTSTTATSTSTVTTTEDFLPEIREPVLRPSKKETGRSLRLPEITEPILRPRATRHNTRNEAVPQQYDNQRDEIQETSSTSTRSFTVQFLPERLASILAQAERYARQTLLPLISQYTPSFMTGMRSHEEPKYFPLLGTDVAQPRNTAASAEMDKTTDRQRNSDQLSQRNIKQRKSDESFSLVEDKRHHEESKSRPQMENGENVSNEYSVSKAKAPPVIVEAVYPEKVADANFTDPSETRTTEIRREDGDRQPMDESTKNVPSRRDGNVSRSLDWSIGHSRDWTFSTDANSRAEVKLDDDWVPITFKNDAEVSTTARLPLTTLNDETAREATDAVDNSRKSAQDVIFDGTKEETTIAANTYERKFIPLLDFEETTGDAFSSTNSHDIPEPTTTASHIQKIPRHEQATMKSARMLMKSTMMFPYAYERRNDPRTRYIPLIPEEDMGKSYSLMERDR